MDITLIRAFIASPGGLESERRAAFAAAEEVNRSVARPMGGRLELIGWEETLSGNGRPQAIINSEMETCDLFIGAIWASWGSRPSHMGPYTSGFEEEFELSRIRYAKTQSPVMAMFFKNVDPLQLRDPGEDLKRVISFQAKMRAEKTFLYGTFGEAEEFASKVREFLSTHTIRILKEVEPQREERPAQPDARDRRSSREGGTVPHDEKHEAAFLVVASKALRSEDGATSAEVARLRLIGTTAGRAGNDKLVLGAHDSNLLYARRQDFKFSFAEKRGLLESGLSGIDHENVPLWSWLAELTRDRPGILIALTVFGEDAARIGALTAMRLLNEPIQQISVLGDDIVAKHWLKADAPTAIKVAALRYLYAHGTHLQLDAIFNEAIRADKDTFAIASEAAVSILLREDKQQAIRYLLSISFETFDNTLLFQAIPHLSDLGSVELTLGLDHRSADIRSRTLQILSERNTLDLDTIGRAREDDAAVVRLAAIQATERMGQPISLDEAHAILSRPRRNAGFLYFGDADSAGVTLFQNYRAERLRQMPVQQLEALLDRSDHRDAAYLALAARRIGDFSERLRTDLRNGFQEYFLRYWPDGIKPTPGAAVSLFSLGTSDPAEAKRRELSRVALDIVASQRDEADLTLIRQVLDQKFAGPTTAVILYLKTLGGAADIARLATTSQYSATWLERGELERDFDEAARTILRLYVGDFTNLISQSLPNAMRGRLIDLVPPKDFAQLDDQLIVSLLLKEEHVIRRATAKKIPSSLSRSRVSKVLAAYKADEEGRYYLVTHWLDLGLGYSRMASRRVASSKK